MAERKIPLTLDQHRAIGSDLHALDYQITQLITDLSNTLGKSNRACVPLRRAGREMSGCRCALEEVLHRQYQEQLDTHIYYCGVDAPVTRFTKDSDRWDVVKLLNQLASATTPILNTLYLAIPVGARPCKKLEQVFAALNSARVRVETTLM